MNKIIVIFFLLSAILHESFSATNSSSTSEMQEPSSVPSEVENLLEEMAKANGYTDYDTCHIVPWSFIKKMALDSKNETISNRTLSTFIEDLAKIHEDAAFYDPLSSDTKGKLENLTKKYQEGAETAMNDGNMEEAATALYNMPSNMFPCSKNNTSGNTDTLNPPKAMGSGNGTAEVSSNAKKLYETYEEYGLTKLDKPGDGDLMKSAE